MDQRVMRLLFLRYGDIRNIRQIEEPFTTFFFLLRPYEGIQWEDMLAVVANGMRYGSNSPCWL
jgi:hypothetical protein